MIAPQQVFTKTAGVETATFGGEQVVLDPHRRMLRGLNPTGARVWELVDGRRSVQDIASQLAAETGVELARALEDVVAFLSALEERKLVSAGG